MPNQEPKKRKRRKLIIHTRPGRPTTRVIKSIPDTFDNVLKSVVKTRPISER